MKKLYLCTQLILKTTSVYENMRQVVIYPGDDGYWVAECPSLPGCISQGMNKEEAMMNIKEAIQGYMNALREDGLVIPGERNDTKFVAV